jgi:hypothetical protein
MRSYWLKILLGALGIFAVGMIGVSLVRGGIAKVHSVVEGEGPITIPLGLIPFVLAGERLGNLDKVTLHRDTPTRVSEVELWVNLSDSLLAQGLSGCQLAANFSGDSTDRGVNIKVGPDRGGAFYCVPEDSVPADLVEYGVAILNPGDIDVPLLLPTDLVTEMQSLRFGHDTSTEAASDPLAGITVPNADSIRADVARRVSRADSVQSPARRFADSIRAEALKRIAEDADPQ